ncbi:MAG: magnesium protoporphyrin IX methyltransferase [Pseudorhodoplanes sp.]|nr:magnesium protoporphyrin IX methyltransferase [Pseudorhodoplanes sp.]
MQTASYIEQRARLETYFDRTAVDAWSRLTSDAPVSRIRATVRAGRDRMRSTLLSWLPESLLGRRLLDAGCGTGALAIEAARRGASVVAIDVAPTLVRLAQERAPQDLAAGTVEFRTGDMLDSSLGAFDHVVAMDSLIHYRPADCVEAVASLAARTRRTILFTFAPRTPLLAAMHGVGRLFPRAERAPSIQPVAEATLVTLIENHPGLRSWRRHRTQRIVNGFYTSQAMELRAR